jgi:glycosyltransferase involved in cell wall biosynthesis
MKVLLLSAYHAQSHAQWVEGLQRHLPDFEWTVLTLPARYFNWRIRGNSLSWAFGERDLLREKYDVVLATSMCDLSSLVGFVPELAHIPKVVYCHENQFAYPASGRQKGLLEAQVLNIYTALAADQLIFNSEYNRRTFLEGSVALLNKMPDFVPMKSITAQLAKSEVLPVGIECVPISAESLRDENPSEDARLWLVWNHRWEYDKGPEQLLVALRSCENAGLPLDVSIVGQQFRRQPEAFSEIERLIARSDSLKFRHWGFLASRDDYAGLLSQADVVLSTASHDFQGLSVLEAAAAGCTPLLPNRLAYPEWFDGRFLYPDCGEGIAEEGEAVAQSLAALLNQKRCGALPKADVTALSWQRLAPQYRHVLESAASSKSRGDSG